MIVTVTLIDDSEKVSVDKLIDTIEKNSKWKVVDIGNIQKIVLSEKGE